MKKALFLIAMIPVIHLPVDAQVLFSGTSGNFVTDSKAPGVNVRAPNGGERLQYDIPMTIRWEAQDESFGATPIALTIRTAPGGPWTILANGLPNTGSQVVNPPGITSDHALVKVSARDIYGNMGEDVSDACFYLDDMFSGVTGTFITDSKPPDVMVIRPNGGEWLGYMDSLDVAWTATDDEWGHHPISVAVSKQPGGSYSFIQTDLDNTGFARVAPPEAVTEYARVWVVAVDYFGSVGYDKSDAYLKFDDRFSDTTANSFKTDSKPPEVLVGMPNGGERVDFSEPVLVTWTATDESLGANPISIGLSTEEGGSYSIIAPNLPNSGSTVISSLGVITRFARIFVIARDYFGVEGEDRSDEYFIVEDLFTGGSASFVTDSKPPEITVLVPNGGEGYFFSDPLLVKWDASDDSFGPLPVVKISVSTDGGLTYQTVASGLPDIDSAFVTAPEAITQQAMVKIKVKDSFGLVADDESDGVFSLLGLYTDLKAFLEGPFTGTEMNTIMNQFGYLPLSQPFSAPPWNYGGTESVQAIPNSDVVDWVLIELRDAPDAVSATSATTIGRRAGFILRNGMVTGADGVSDMIFGIPVTQNLFAIVRQRNHLAVMSALPLNRTNDTFDYDFTTGAEQAFGGNLGHKEIGTGIWGMAGGDGDANGTVNNGDKNDIWVQQAGTSGYLPGDFNLDSDVNNSDKIEIWVPNGGRSSQVPL
ncbi:MAG: hypothetical protein JW861_10200 [Bacteroidales bacterium]|nr:hypothetical protein [Bacteroidales bacterium]